jgi:hypothetical protein
MKTRDSCNVIMSKPYTPEGEATWERVFGKTFLMDELTKMYEEMEDERREPDKS